jgi:phosphate transport system substrate-binding protein
VFSKIARDGVCMITNPKNPISNLNQQAVQAIFTGNVREWSEVPGSKMSGPIDLVDRIASSGTQDAFQNIFLGPTLKISPSAAAEETNGLVQNKVKVDEHAIGFVSFAFTSGVNAVGYQGIPCTLRNAKSGQYQGVRNFWMVTKGIPKGAAAKFITWVTSSKNKTAKKIISSQWIPVH